MPEFGSQHMANHIPMKNSYCNSGLVQPSFVMNHQGDCHEDVHPILATNISEFFWSLNLDLDF